MDLKVEKLISGARGLAHLNGKNVFIANALPNEVVEVEIKEEKKGFIEATATKILEPSSYRKAPVCPYYGLCGGCDFQIVEPKVSATFKEEIVKDNLRRIGKIDYPIFFLPPAYAPFSSYRSRSRVHVDLKTKKQGFLSKNTNSIVDISSCPALVDKLNNLLEDKSGYLYKRARALMFENKVNRNTGFVEIPLFAGDSSVSSDSKSVEVSIGDIRYQVSANVFFQSNLGLLPELLSFVKENTIGNTIMDLYSGVGTFSALFEKQGKRVYAVEKQKECLSLSHINAPSAISYTSDVFAWARKLKTSVDTVIVDPPRVGLESGVSELISSWKPQRIIYISCNSVTASRDIALFESYHITKAKVFDFYPGTGHEESGFVLENN